MKVPMIIQLEYISPPKITSSLLFSNAHLCVYDYPARKIYGKDHCLNLFGVISTLGFYCIAYEN
jgi:hypothetical protein